MCETIAIYRVLYGADFIEKSINSIIDHVDKVYVCWTDRPWGKSNGCTYLGRFYPWLKNFDNIVEVVNSMKNDKVKTLYDHRVTPKNQYCILTHRIITEKLGNITPKIGVYMEPDQVFRPGRFKEVLESFKSSVHKTIAHPQIEVWKDWNYRVPQRGRLGAFMYNFEKLQHVPNTGFSGHQASGGPTISSEQIYNFGFSFNAKTMFWKHLTALAFSKEIGDSLPAERWFLDKWMNWTPKTENIEISERWAHKIKKAIPFEMHKDMLEYMNAKR